MGISCVNLGDPVSRIEIEYVCYKDNATYEFPSKVTISKYISVLQERHAAAYAEGSRYSRDKNGLFAVEDEDIIINPLGVC